MQQTKMYHFVNAFFLYDFILLVNAWNKVNKFNEYSNWILLVENKVAFKLARFPKTPKVILTRIRVNSQQSFMKPVISPKKKKKKIFKWKHFNIHFECSNSCLNKLWGSCLSTLAHHDHWHLSFKIEYRDSGICVIRNSYTKYRTNTELLVLCGISNLGNYVIFYSCESWYQWSWTSWNHDHDFSNERASFTMFIKKSSRSFNVTSPRIGLEDNLSKAQMNKSNGNKFYPLNVHT